MTAIISGRKNIPSDVLDLSPSEAKFHKFPVVVECIDEIAFEAVSSPKPKNDEIESAVSVTVFEARVVPVIQFIRLVIRSNRLDAITVKRAFRLVMNLL